MEDLLKLKELLRLENITKIYIVDDALVGGDKPSLANFKGAVLSLLSSDGLDKLKSFDESIDFVNNEPIIEEYIDQVWEKATAEEQLKYLRRVYELMDNQVQATEIDVSSSLKALFEQIELLDILELLTPDKWDDKIEAILASIPADERVIVLFDQNLEKAGGRFESINGIDLIKELLQREDNSKISPGLLSYKVETIGAELPYRAEIQRKYKLQLCSFFVLSKRRIEDLIYFVDGLKKMLLNNPCEQLKTITAGIVKQAFENTLEAINELDTYDFDYTVLKSSSVEGVWEPNTLFRIVEVLFKDQTQRIILKEQHAVLLNKWLAKAKTLSKVEIELESSELPYTKKFNLRHQEIYAPGDIINGLGKPLENGDIFNIYDGGKKGTYILIGQPCDLMIRSDGKRYPDNGVCYLIKVQEMSPAELKDKMAVEAQSGKKPHGFDFWRTKAKIEYLDEGKQTVGLIQLGRHLIARLDVLDLVVFNEKGEATIDINSSNELDKYSDGVRARYVRLKEEYVNQAVELEKYDNALKEVHKSIRQSILKKMMPNLAYNDSAGKATPFTKGVFSFGIKRVQALRDPYARDLLDKYSEFLARPAEQHDFAM